MATLAGTDWKAVAREITPAPTTVTLTMTEAHFYSLPSKVQEAIRWFASRDRRVGGFGGTVIEFEIAAERKADLLAMMEG